MTPESKAKGRLSSEARAAVRMSRFRRRTSPPQSENRRSDALMLRTYFFT